MSIEKNSTPCFYIHKRGIIMDSYLLRKFVPVTKGLQVMERYGYLYEQV